MWIIVNNFYFYQLIGGLVVFLVAKLCSTLCDSMNYSPPGSSYHGISQARTLEWVAFPSPGDLPDPMIQPVSLVLASIFFTGEPQGKPRLVDYYWLNKVDYA